MCSGILVQYTNLFKNILAISLLCKVCFGQIIYHTNCWHENLDIDMGQPTHGKADLDLATGISLRPLAIAQKHYPGNPLVSERMGLS